MKNKKQDILRKNRRRMAAEAMKQWNTCCHIEGVKKSQWPFSQDHDAGNPKARAASNKDVRTQRANAQRRAAYAQKCSQLKKKAEEC